MNTFYTNQGKLTLDQIMEHLEYSSYRANRSYGMTHEQLGKLGIGNDFMKEKYETEKNNKEKPL